MAADHMISVGLHKLKNIKRFWRKFRIFFFFISVILIEIQTYGDRERKKKNGKMDQ